MYGKQGKTPYENKPRTKLVKEGCQLWSHTSEAANAGAKRRGVS